MGRKKKIKPEVVAEAAPMEENKITNDAVFTEYPAMSEYVVEKTIKPVKHLRTYKISIRFREDSLTTSMVVRV